MARTLEFTYYVDVLPHHGGATTQHPFVYQWPPGTKVQEGARRFKFSIVVPDESVDLGYVDVEESADESTEA